ncbi:MAG: trypsin-like peptidase domain-containing protein [Spirochaetaceae bacterium]|jgi:serine protease Do|nr:trypsin-like peptidase domain-containing protein [Spirochaetaceae bacterium]
MKKTISTRERQNNEFAGSSSGGRVALFRCIVFLFTIFGGVVFCFGQTESLRDYVGLINQSFHPDIVSYLVTLRTEFEKRGNTDAARGIDNYLKGGSGTGFVYVAPDGANYIITNHHVITQSYDISVTFEKLGGTRVKYEGLTIFAADEDMDIALLAFPKEERPFTRGLVFLDRPVNEGEDVYSAGFPALGTTNLWQLGRGMVSNAHVEFPENDRDEKSRIMGPYIQHTAQIDPGNSGGPLLVRVQDVPAGYVVAGINTLSARFRQAANFAIPMDRVQAFLDSALGPKPEDERRILDARLNNFIDGIAAPGAVYEHIAKYLSNACTAENAEYALTEMMRNANRTVQYNIIRAFIYSPVEGMSYAVAWTIENTLRGRTGRIAMTVDSVVPANENSYTVTFTVNGRSISSVWVNDYGIWRINSFDSFAAGDKTLVEKRDQTDRDTQRLKTDYGFHLAAGFAYSQEVGPAFGADFKYHANFAAYGLRLYTAGKKFFQIEFTTGLYIPVRIKKVGFTPYGNLGLGFAVMESAGQDSLYDNQGVLDAGFDLSLEGGMLFTPSLVSGLFVQASYQHNFYSGNIRGIKPGIIFISIGYGF